MASQSCHSRVTLRPCRTAPDSSRRRQLAKPRDRPPPADGWTGDRQGGTQREEHAEHAETRSLTCITRHAGCPATNYNCIRKVQALWPGGSFDVPELTLQAYAELRDAIAYK